MSSGEYWRWHKTLLRDNGELKLVLMGILLLFGFASLAALGLSYILQISIWISLAIMWGLLIVDVWISGQSLAHRTRYSMASGAVHHWAFAISSSGSRKVPPIAPANHVTDTERGHGICAWVSSRGPHAGRSDIGCFPDTLLSAISLPHGLRTPGDFFCVNQLLHFGRQGCRVPPRQHCRAELHRPAVHIFSSEV